VNFGELIFAVQKCLNFAELNFAERSKKLENKFSENLYPKVIRLNE